MSLPITKSLRHQSKAMRNSARGQECLVRIPGICNGNTETVVLAHLGGGGMATKHSDLFGCFACSSCHSAIDGATKTDYSNAELKLMQLQAIIRTQQYWLNSGMVELA